MKKFLYVLLLLTIGATATFAQTSKPKTKETKTAETKVETREPFDPKRVPADDLKSAVTKATAENKRIVLDIGGEWCGWCRYMDSFFTKSIALAKLRDDNFVWVKVNFSEENENAEFLSAYPKIIGYPHLFVLDKDGKLLHSQETAELEEEKGYNLPKFTEFLTKWSPVKTDTK